jgi:hypothetical protein
MKLVDDSNKELANAIQILDTRLAKVESEESVFPQASAATNVGEVVWFEGKLVAFTPEMHAKLHSDLNAQPKVVQAAPEVAGSGTELPAEVIAPFGTEPGFGKKVYADSMDKTFGISDGKGCVADVRPVTDLPGAWTPDPPAEK